MAKKKPTAGSKEDMTDNHLTSGQFHEAIGKLTETFRAGLGDLASEMGEMKTDVAVIKNDIDHQKNHIEDLEIANQKAMDDQMTKNNRWNIINSAGIFFGSALAAIIGTKK